MGLTVALNNALSGMKAGQDGLDVLSRNVANSGTPGYHKQSLSVIDTLGANSSYVRSGTVTRAFNQTLQNHYTLAASDSGYVNIRSSMLDRWQVALGKPGEAGSIDSAFGDFQTAMSALATSPDNYATRAQAVTSAQTLAGTLNDLSNQLQSLRREAEGKMEANVTELNQQLAALEKINGRLADQGLDESSRATLMDQRDRLVSQVAERVDVRVDYRSDGTVALMTRSGVGLLDHRASVFEFQSAGVIAATSRVSTDPAESGVGRLLLRTPAGLTIDAVQQNVFRSGEMAGLIDMRDNTLVQAQDQLDEIAASLAQAMSTVQTQGTAVASGGASGLEVDLSAIRNGNDFVLDYTQAGTRRSLQVVRVDDAAKLPLDYVDARGRRVIGLDFSGGTGSVAAQLQTVLGSGFAVTNPSGDVLRVMDDGAAGQTDVVDLRKRATVTGNQDAGLALSLFVDTGNSDFTNGLDGDGQKLGFASRIAVNAAVISDSRLMIQYETGGSLGNADRANYLLDQLDTMQFAMANGGGEQRAAFRISGSISELISQTVNYQGNAAAGAIGEAQTQELTLVALTQRMDTEYGVDVDAEMARLMELQNAFAANGRVISVIQDLLNQLLQI